ncbi:sulfotransferase [uncultured Halovibrio sp.]|uniref:sulfotransferase family protein n=1 Tax=uncultured Halovibrio sp. TaxID=985049 RepID=UPI00343526A0
MIWMNCKPIMIIGAPRSGTNMLRNALTSLEGISTWPCDEINYIWRHGNVRYPSDEIPAENATEPVALYIRGCFTSMARRTDAETLVEKTCANCLRVPFVDRVVPEARYIYIVRDGIDAIGSARQRWTAGLDIPYLLEKVRFVPVSDLPYYAFRYFWARLFRLVSREKRLAFWGPALDNMQAILRNHSLNEVCALQWQRCVDKADEALSRMPESKVLHVSYETFVREPEAEMRRILSFMGHDEVPDDTIANAVAGVSSKTIGKGRKALGDDEVAGLEALVSSSLRRYGYL